MSADRSRELVICVIGSDFFCSVLDHLVKGKSVQERAIVVRGLPTGDDLLACHMVFVSAIEARHTADILLRVGGHARFYVENNHIRVEINAVGADQAGLKINSQLLRLAKR